MPFLESVKGKARKLAHYRCVVCHEPFVDVHHIIPESQGGANDLDNAAALCSRCHDYFGNNPDKRKQIRGQRDLWHELCANVYNEEDIRVFEKLNSLYNEMIAMRSEQREYRSILDEIKATLSGTLSSTASVIDKAESFDDIVTTAGYVTGSRLGENVYANVYCRKCNTRIGLLVGTDKCPQCGAQIERL